jgi:hypothetical protein
MYIYLLIMTSKQKDIQKDVQKNNIKSTKSVKSVKSVKSTNSNKNANDDGIITITDDKTINEILGNIGKKSKNNNKKELINNFIENKNNYDKTNTKTNQKNFNEDENNEKKKTFTENLTKDEINEKLEDYKLVDDMTKVPLDTHLRYFVKKDNEMLFRMGGNLKRNLDLPKFIVLKNAVGAEWTVQVKDTIFYKKMSIKEIKNEYDEIISELHDKIKKLKAKIKELEK